MRARLLLILCLFAPSVLAAAPAQAVPAGVPLVVAHRGGAGLRPENTMAAFRNAVTMGVDVLEFDIKLTSDGVPVVIHDATLDRTTNCAGPVASKTFAQLRACDAGYRFTLNGGATFPYRGAGVTVPSLDEVLRYGRSVNIAMDPEIKNLPTDGDFAAKPGAYTAPVAAVVQATGAQGLITFTSFWPPNLESIRGKLPGVRTALLTQGAVKPLTQTAPRFPCLANVAFATIAGYDVSQPEYLSADIRPCLKAAVALGRHVDVWTVDDPAAMAEMASLGATGIITNRPDLLLALEGR